MFPRPRVVVSKCLGFDACRYDGKIIEDKFLEQLEPHVEYVSVCPEVEIGLAIPREPMRLVSIGKRLRLLQPATGQDFTGKMRRFSAAFLSALGEVDGCVLKSRSPSCALDDAKVYARPKGERSIARMAGFFGGAMLKRFPHLAVEDERRLENSRIRAHFLTRIFASARFRQVKRRNLLASLVRFHGANKLLLMAYSRKQLQALDRIVATAERKKPAQVLGAYQQHFYRALARLPRRTSNPNALIHALGYFADQLSQRLPLCSSRPARVPKNCSGRGLT